MKQTDWMDGMEPLSPLTPKEMWEWWETLVIGSCRPLIPSTPREIQDYYNIYGRLPPALRAPDATEEPAS